MNSNFKKPQLICEEHQKEVILFCLNEFCKESRLICIQCIQQSRHNGHSKDQNKIEELYQLTNTFEILYEKHREQIQNIAMVNLNIFYRIIERCTEKFQIFCKDIHESKLEELNQKINFMMQAEKQLNQLQQRFQQSFENLFQSCNLYSEELQLNQGNLISIFDQQQSETLQSKGEQLHREKNLEEAITYFDYSLFFNPKNKYSLFLKGDSLLQQKRIDESNFYNEKVLALDKDYIDAIHNKGRILRLNREFQEAMHWLDKALNMNPQRAYTLWEKGVCLRLLNKFDEAIECFKKSLIINPQQPGFLSDYGITLMCKNEHVKSLEFFDKAIKIDPCFVYGLLHKGKALQHLSRHKEAIECFDKILSITPKNDEAIQLKQKSQQKI